MVFCPLCERGLWQKLLFFVPHNCKTYIVLCDSFVLKFVFSVRLHQVLREESERHSNDDQNVRNINSLLELLRLIGCGSGQSLVKKLPSGERCLYTFCLKRDRNSIQPVSTRDDRATQNLRPHAHQARCEKQFRTRKSYCSNRTVHTAGNKQHMKQQATKWDLAPFFPDARRRVQCAWGLKCPKNFRPGG